MCWTLFGRTELILGASKAKYYEELDFEIHFDVAPQNREHNKNWILETEQIRETKVRVSKHKMLGIV